jgi:hypothetical protein
MNRMPFVPRLSKDLKLLTVERYSYAAENVEEIGPMASGWRKSAGRLGPNESGWRAVGKGGLV